MEGEVQPKFGLMATLLLMNLTAIALFFFATPAPQETSKKRADNAEHVPEVGLKLAGDAQTKVKDDKCSVETVVKKTRKSHTQRSSLAQVQTLPGKVEMRVVTPKNTMETSDEPAEPPLAIALKKFVGSTKSGVRLVFEGLKNGYTQKRISISPENDAGTNFGKHSPADPENSRPTPKSFNLLSSLQGSKANGPQNMKNIPRELSPARKQPKPTAIKPEEGGNCLNLDVIPTEFVIDAISRAQHRTNELIYVFSKRVIPAIESMNERVAEAIRLEKNLDSYTSTLINAINSVVCPNTSDVNVGRKTSHPGTSSKKPKNARPFASELSLMRDPRISDNNGTHSKGEHSSATKRPVFKTLAARCWHRRRRSVNKIRKAASKPDEPECSRGLRCRASKKCPICILLVSRKTPF